MHLARHERTQPEDRFEEFGLAVARHAGDADDLTGAHLERRVRAPPCGRRWLRTETPLTTSAEQRAARAALGGQRRHALADHLLDEFRVGQRSPGSSPLTTIRPPRSTVTRSAMARVSRSLCVMITIGQSVAAEPVDHAEQRVDLLRGERARRLVEDDDARLGDQHPDEFDDLALRQAQVADQRVGVDRAGRAVGRLDDPGAGRRRAQPAGAGRQLDVLEHREGRDEPQVLEHHADAVAAGVDRRSDLDGLAVDADLALVGWLMP